MQAVPPGAGLALVSLTSALGSWCKLGITCISLHTLIFVNLLSMPKTDGYFGCDSAGANAEHTSHGCFRSCSVAGGLGSNYFYFAE